MSTCVLEMKGRREVGARGRCDCLHGSVKEEEVGRKKRNGEIASPPRTTSVCTCALREEIFVAHAESERLNKRDMETNGLAASRCN